MHTAYAPFPATAQISDSFLWAHINNKYKISFNLGLSSYYYGQNKLFVNLLELNFMLASPTYGHLSKWFHKLGH